jgi:sRNA-binding carbon storage regulator CsrA
VFPPDATVLRKEIYDKILAENMAAAGSSAVMMWISLKCRVRPVASGRLASD